MELAHSPRPRLRARDPRRQRGQVIVIFAGSMIALVALCAVVVDVAWYWTNNLRMQRAADAAALAGVVWLPGNVDTAYTTARKEAKKNGYEDGVGGIVVTPVQDPTNTRRLKVTISGPVGTFFARAVGINSWPAQREAKADYVLPVPMGSPDNYYGVGYYVEPVTTTTTHTSTSHASDDSGLVGGPTGVPSTPVNGGTWTTVGNGGTIQNALTGNNNVYAVSSTDLAQQQWISLGLATGSGSSPIPNPAANQVLTVTGLEVRLDDAFLSGSCNGSKIGVELSWNDGAAGSWSSLVTTPNLRTNTSNGDYVLGNANNLTPWGAHAWTRSDFTDAKFQVRLTADKGCTNSSREIRLDQLRVQVYWDMATTTTTTTTTTTLVDDATVPPPPGQSAITRPQKFWGAMQSQGAPSIQGDAFMTKYDTRTSINNDKGGSDPDTYYDYTNYYNYAVEIPAGGGGSVWIFDPGFCDGTTSAGTGENWTVGGSNGYSSRQPVSAFFDLWDTKETLLDQGDDTLVGSTNSDFRRLLYEDHTIFDEKGLSTHVADCSSQSWHLGWYQIATGLPEGTYRLHTYSTDTGSLGDQDDTTALNSFAFYASSASGTPRIHGLGAMEAYVRLPAGQVSEFYLAQIEKVHAGKTMVINLWDPGDTGDLSASLQILAPTGTGFTPAQFDYKGTPGNTNATSGCGSRSGTDVYSVTTNTGGSSLYNGCWLTIEVQLPIDYSAPPDPDSGEDGWWKIRYSMGNQSGNGATDLTTWKVDIRGNPVHLVLP